MVYISEGEFVMGSSFFESIIFTNGKLFMFPDQRPKHKVYLDGYWIDQTEVTVGMFKKFIHATGYKTSAEREGWGKPWKDGPKENEWPKILGTDWLHPQGFESFAQDDHPVVQVSWEDGWLTPDGSAAHYRQKRNGKKQRAAPMAEGFPGVINLMEIF